MPKLPDQRGFYDDVRPFMRRDVKVHTEAYAPTPGQQVRKQILWGLLALVFLGVTAYLRLHYESVEARQTYKEPGHWKGVAKGVSTREQPKPAAPHK